MKTKLSPQEYRKVLTPLQQALREKHTLLKSCVIGGQDGLSCIVQLKVGNQQFTINDYSETVEDGEWLRDMLAVALDNLIKGAK